MLPRNLENVVPLFAGPAGQLKFGPGTVNGIIDGVDGGK